MSQICSRFIPSTRLVDFKHGLKLSDPPPTDKESLNPGELVTA